MPVSGSYDAPGQLVPPPATAASGCPTASGTDTVGGVKMGPMR